jgi:hypothetical protein
VTEVGVGERSERFLQLSALLTGFGRMQLLGTGMADAYLCTLEETLPVDTLDELLAAYDGLPAGGDRESAVTSRILADAKLGPVARNVILLWYSGTWTALPDRWQAAYGSSALDTDRVVSGDAYQAGLQWVVAAAHPAGAQQQGYGAWAQPPEGISR